MENEFLKYYGDKNISPVKQDIDDLQLHFEKRRKLYRQCGIPTIAFRNAEMLEVGPGSGYNTLAFFEWGCKHIDLVEPNPRGRDDMEMLFLKHGIEKSKYTVFSDIIENYSTEKRYDIIIAEGFLAFLPNGKECISTLFKLLEKNGILVITCSDYVCFFIEGIKRLLGVALTREIQDFEDKVDFLTNIFKEQLLELEGMSRYPKDWVQDQIFNPILRNGCILSLGDVISSLDKDFEILGSSPSMFTDYSWYKNIEYDYKKEYLEQFNKKRLTLLMAGMEEICTDSSKVERLVEHFGYIRKLSDKYENDYDNKHVQGILDEMDKIESVNVLLPQDFLEVFQEIRLALQDALVGKIDVNKYSHFFRAFGRTQQYISFIKKES